MHPQTCSFGLRGRLLSYTPIRPFVRFEKHRLGKPTRKNDSDDRLGTETGRLTWKTDLDDRLGRSTRNIDSEDRLRRKIAKLDRPGRPSTVLPLCKHLAPPFPPLSLDGAQPGPPRQSRGRTREARPLGEARPHGEAAEPEALLGSPSTGT
jgi:hypothetical protein